MMWMRAILAALAACVWSAGSDATQAAGRACRNPHALGVARVIEIDTRNGGVYGAITKFRTQELLRPGEVVLTFDDGPLPAITRPVLDILDRHCTKATFFLVGKMARAHPELVREEIARGHTVGTHTWSHPSYMRRLPFAATQREIDRGIEAVTDAAGGPIAAFFRFPGLGDSSKAITHLADRGIATFSVDVVSNDSFIRDPLKLTRYTMNVLERRGRGILLFHDIKPVTLRALPLLLDELKLRGFKVVHLRPRTSGNVVAVSAPPQDQRDWGAQAEAADADSAIPSGPDAADIVAGPPIRLAALLLENSVAADRAIDVEPLPMQPWLWSSLVEPGLELAERPQWSAIPGVPVN